MTKSIHWQEEPEEHNYPDAENYLTLHFSRETARGLIGRARYAGLEWFKARDILRASGHPLADQDHEQVKKTILKIHAEKFLSPVVLVRSSTRLIIADGYHRVCAVVWHDHDARVPAKIV